jgi:hypothetical protein
MWSQLFTGQPRTVFDAYNDTATALSKIRSQKIANALNQIKLNYAPQMAQQAALQAVANTQIKQSDASYEPRMNAASLGMKNAQIMATNLESAGRRLDNVSKYYQAIGAPQDIQNKLKIQQGQLALLYAKAKALGGGATTIPQSSATPLNSPSAQSTAMGYQSLDPASMATLNPKSAVNTINPDTGVQEQIPKGLYDPNAPALLAGKSFPSQNSSEDSSFIPSVINNPRVPNLFLPTGVQTQRGTPEGLYDPATGQSLSVITPQQRTQIQNQVYAIKQAKEMLPAIKAYGTTGKFQASGLSKFLPASGGGVSLNDAAKYEMVKNLGVEQLMTATKLNKTDETINMMKTVISRQNGESREGYSERLDAFDKKLNEISQERNQDLKLGGIPLNDDNSNQAFLIDAYNQALGKSAKSMSVRMVGTDGIIYKIPADKADDAIKNFQMKLVGQ